MLYVIATLTVRPEKRADFLENARVVIAATLREEGCLHYDLMSSITEPNIFAFVERWTSREALEGHFRAPHSLTWRSQCEDYVLERRVEIVTPAGVETR